MSKVNGLSSGNLNLGQVVDTAASGELPSDRHTRGWRQRNSAAFADSSLETVNIVFTRSGSTVEWVLAENSGTLKTPASATLTIKK